MSSTTSLISSESKQKQSPQKDWTLAFATLSSLYGFNGKAPSTPSTPQKPSNPSTSSFVSSPRSKNDDDAAPTNSPPVRKTPSPEGYELAFGQLASSYGFGGVKTYQPKKQ